MSSKKIIVSVTSDLSTDQRVHKVCTTLTNEGYSVLLLGRKLRSSNPLKKRNYSCKRFSLFFENGFLFYASFNIRLFFYLLFHNADVLLANDLDTLPANYCAAKLKRIPIIYDSHEYFTEVPELQERKFVKGVWEQLERIILPQLKYTYTVSKKIADSYRQKYDSDFKLVRNFPRYSSENLTTDKKNAIIYQGALNEGRGLEELVEAMVDVNSAELWLVGAGDIEAQLRKMVNASKLEKKVKFYGRLEPTELRKVTQKAKIGVSLEKKLGLNYTYALPNKIFDYIHAGTPALYSGLEEVVETLKPHQVGEELISHESKQIAGQLNQMLNSDQYSDWVKSCKAAAELFNWEKEEPTVLAIFNQALSN